MNDRRFGRTRKDEQIDAMHKYDTFESRGASRKAKERFKRPAYGACNLIKHSGQQYSHEE